MNVLMMSNSSQCNKMWINWSYQLQTIIYAITQTIIVVISRDNHTDGIDFIKCLYLRLIFKVCTDILTFSSFRNVFIEVGSSAFYAWWTISAEESIDFWNVWITDAFSIILGIKEGKLSAVAFVRFLIDESTHTIASNTATVIILFVVFLASASGTFFIQYLVSWAYNGAFARFTCIDILDIAILTLTGAIIFIINGISNTLASVIEKSQSESICRVALNTRTIGTWYEMRDLVTFTTLKGMQIVHLSYISSPMNRTLSPNFLISGHES